MYGRAFHFGMMFFAALAAGRAIAADPPTVPVASYIQTPGNGPMAKTFYYHNDDKIHTTPVASIGAPGPHTNATQTTITPKSELFTTSDANSTTPGSTAVKFLLDVESGPFAAIFANPQDALFTFSAVSTHAPVLSDGLFTQIFDSGTLSFTRTSPLYTLDAFGNPTGDALTNLLTISFTNAVLTASAGGLTMAFTADTSDSTISYTSDFRTFTSAEEEAAFNFAISGADASSPIARAPVDPALTHVTGTRSLNSFRASTTGTFAAPPIPEPQSWALFLIGFGAIGAMRRAVPRRRRPDRLDGGTIERYLAPNL
jgi:hypothetical protein